VTRHECRNLFERYTFTRRKEAQATGRKRISTAAAKAIAKERMELLLSLAETEALKGNVERGRRYVSLARKIGMRTNTSMPAGTMYCKRCLSPLIPGRNCVVRLRSNRISVTCKECGYIRRRPFLKEKRGQ
jgi:ribonuclease P protein subunit RPR2